MREITISMQSRVPLGPGKFQVVVLVNSILRVQIGFSRLRGRKDRIFAECHVGVCQHYFPKLCQGR